MKPTPARLLAPAFLAAALWGSAGHATAPAAQSVPLSRLTFERSVDLFPLADQSGRPFAMPWLGGLDVPRPQFVDIDTDGDADLFVQEYSNALMFFENTVTAGAPRYQWRSDRYEGLEIGEWYRFVDIDADGRVDLVGEVNFSQIRFYRNVGTPQKAVFEPAGVLLDTDGEPVFFDRQNVPAFVDLDCDKRLDLFVGRVEGTVTRFEAEQPGSVRFSFLEERYEGIEIVGRIGGTPSMHGANALAFGDYDGDGDMDLFWGDFFEPGMLLIENVGATCSTPSFQVEPVVLGAASILTSGYNAPAPIDLDQDGDLDFLMGVLGGAFNPIKTSADNFYHWERTGPGAFELRTKRFLDGLDLGSETLPVPVDLDGDGDLDLVVGNKIDPVAADAGRLAVFTNEGTKTAPSYRWTDTWQIADAYHLAPAFGDIDGDGDLDMLLGTWNQDVLFFRNQGSARAPRWVKDEAGTIRPPRVSQAAPALADIDGDGDLDLFIGQANGAITFYRNEGTPRAPRFTLVSERLDDIRVGRRSVPAVVDVDGDGLLDLVIGREERGAVTYRNAGTATAPRFVEHKDFSLPLPPLSSPAFADVTGDGVVDVLSGTASGGVALYRGRTAQGRK